MNRLNAEARTLTDIEFPSKFVWDSSEKQWTVRKKGFAIGRMVSVHPTFGELYYLRMLLNIVKGPTGFEEIITYEGKVYPTYKEACSSRGLLDDDNEWVKAMNEASSWAMPNQLRQLFVNLLLFCDVGNPCKLWESKWQKMEEDIEYKQRRITGFLDLKLQDDVIQNYTLFEIEKLLQELGKTMKDFDGMPLPSSGLMKQLENSLIMEETSYDILKLKKEQKELFRGLNVEQLVVYDKVENAVHSGIGGLFFLHGHRGTGKTYTYRTILARLRSEGQIALAVASSGVASLLMSGGRTAHSRFQIPINFHETLMCDIKQGTQLAELIHETDLIIRDEAPMAHEHAFEAVDRSLRDILSVTEEERGVKPFGGKTILLGGDFRQILPVVKKGMRQETILASIKRSYLWKECQVFYLTENMRNVDHSPEFEKWILTIENRDGANENEVKIPEGMLLYGQTDPITTIATSIFASFKTEQTKEKYLVERAILTVTNETVDEINKYMLNMVHGEKKTYQSSDAVAKEIMEETDHDLLYPVEFLNSLKVPGIPNHNLHLRVNAPVMLLRNVSYKLGMYNGTRMIITKLGKQVIEGKNSQVIKSA